jgi:selenocysteine lyase/cysteine desulfurase
VHGFGNQNVDVAKTGCDFFATGTHKWLFAPRGTGFLWGRTDAWPELRPTIPTFDPDVPQPWTAWMDRTAPPPTQAAFVSPGGFPAFEHLLAVPAAVELHNAIGRDRIATRIRDLNMAFREGAAKINLVTLHTPATLNCPAESLASRSQASRRTRWPDSIPGNVDCVTYRIQRMPERPNPSLSAPVRRSQRNLEIRRPTDGWRSPARGDRAGG